MVRPSGVGDLDLDVLAVQGVDDGVDGALAAVGHRNADAFGIGYHRVHAGAHRGDRFGRSHRLLERVRSENDLHPALGFILAVTRREYAYRVSVGAERNENALELLSLLGGQVRHQLPLGGAYSGVRALQQVLALAGQLGGKRPARRDASPAG